MTDRPDPLLLNLVDALEEDRCEAVLTFQLLADSMERYDLLLLEIRHLQTNLIHAMRFAELHAALRYEESFVFGGAECHDPLRGKGATVQRGWSDIFTDARLCLRPDTLPRLAAAFVPVLPVVDDGTGDPAMTHSERFYPEFDGVIDVHYAWRRVIGPAVRELRRRRITNRWDDTFDLNYRTFVALQALKRNIVVDKLHVAWYGLRAFGRRQLHPPLPSDAAGDRGRRARADFMIVRGASLYNLNDHVTRLADFQAQFETTLDIGSQENHRPITGRRREQGIYHFMLGERAYGMYLDMSRLTYSMLSRSDRDDLFGETPILLHRWAHSYASQNQAMVSFSRSSQRDRLLHSQKHEPGDQRTRPSFASFAITTSFWMPDRPDLQPVIAHEAAHCVVMELFGEFADPTDRANRDGPLFDLWRALLTADDEIRGPHVEAGRRMYEMREIVADLMAATITGPGYLFALYQKLEGWDFGKLARRSDWREWIDLGRMEDILRQGIGHAELNLTWYVRIYVMVEVMAEVFKRDESRPALMDHLVQGIRRSLETLRERMTEMTNPFDHKRVEEWNGFARTLVDRARTAGIVDALYAYYRTRVGTRKAKTANDSARFDPTGASYGEEWSDHFDEPLTFGFVSHERRERLIEYLIERKARAPGRPVGTMMIDPGRFLEGWQAGEGTPQDTELHTVAKRLKNALLEGRYDEGTLSKAVRNDAVGAADAIASFVPLCLGADAEETTRLLDLREKVKTKAERALPPRDEIKGMLTQTRLFDRLSDIPWQTAYIRAMELTTESATGEGCILRALSADYAPGREIMQLAIELWSYGQRRTIDTLSEAVRLSRNLLDLPIGHAHPAPLDPARRERDLLGDILRMLLGPDATTWAARIEEAVARWEEGGVDPTLRQAWREQAAACRKTLTDEEKEKILHALRASLCETFSDWLGASLDGDFGELSVQEHWRSQSGAAPKEKDVLVSALTVGLESATYARAYLTGISALASTGDAGVKLGKALAGGTADVGELAELAADAMLEGDANACARLWCDGTLRDDPDDDDYQRFAAAESAGTMRDRSVLAVRLFEIAGLAARVDALDVEERGEVVVKTMGTLAKRTGAQQVVKLDRSYPDIVFPIWTDRGGIADALDLCRLFLDVIDGTSGTVDHRRKIKAAALLDGPEREIAARKAVEGLHAWLMSRGGGVARVAMDKKALEKAVENLTLKVAEGFLSEWFDGLRQGRKARVRPSVRSLALFAHATETWLHGIIAYIARTDPAILLHAAHAIVTSDLNQERPRPRPLRSAGERMARRRITFIADEKLRALEALVDFKALPTPDLEPLRSLFAIQKRRRTQPGQAALLFYQAISGSCGGLRTFETLSLSRMSLMDAQWWREGRSKGAQTSFYHPGPGRKRPEGGEIVPAGQRMVATLGRYDFFGFSSDPVLNHYRQPILDRDVEADNVGELYTDPRHAFSRVRGERHFRSFFERRENAIVVSLNRNPVPLTRPAMTYRYDGDPKDKEKRKKEILCILSLRLDRRSSRLDFIARLRQARKSWRAFRRFTEEREDAAPDDLLAQTVGGESLLDPKVGLTHNPYASLAWRRTMAARLRRSVRANHEIYASGDDELKRTVDAVFEGRSKNRKELEDLHKKLVAGVCRMRGIAEPFERPDPPRPASHLSLAMSAARLCGDLPLLSLEAVGGFIEDGDCALLGEGWGDLYLIFFSDVCDGENATRVFDYRDGAKRLYDMFALQHTLFQDHEVFRTEMFLGPAAIPFAAADPMSRFQLSIAARLREDRDLDGLVQRTIRSMRASTTRMLAKSLGEEEADVRDIAERIASQDAVGHGEAARFVEKLDDAVRISHIPGRNDLEFWIDRCRDIRNRDDERRLDDVDPGIALGMVHELAGAGVENAGGGAEEISTRVGFRHFMLDPLLE